jgi:hypothetical protein
MTRPAISFAQPLTPGEQAEVLSSAKVRRWLDRIQTEFDVHA